MIPTALRSFALLVMLLLSAAGIHAAENATPSAASTDEWSRFRGPNGTGESEATSVPGKWTESDYNWRVELPGVGHSSPVHWGDRIFLTAAESKGTIRILLCLSAKDGSVIWRKDFASVGHQLHVQNSFASSTPAVDADHVYVLWTTPDQYSVHALHHDGTPAWEANLGKFTSQHGSGTSPIVYDDLVVVGNDQDGDSSLSAIDRKTGQQRWRVPRKTSTVAYSTPCVYQPAKGPAELIFNSQAHGITSINPRDGSTNWEIDVFDKRSVSSPIIVGGHIFGSCGSGAGGNYVVAVKPGKNPQVAFKVDKTAPYVPTSVARGNMAFLWSDQGVITCIDATNGKTLWQKRVGGNFSGSPIRVADKVYCVSAEGDCVVVAASDNYELIAKNPLGETCRSTPSVSDGRLYLRTQSHLISLGGEK
jgi:outer membrane protein assembly factor BamB